VPGLLDAAAHRAALEQLGKLPPLVTSWEVESLKNDLAAAARGESIGKAFVQQEQCLVAKARHPEDCLSKLFRVHRAEPVFRSFVEDHSVDLVVMGAHSDLGQDVLGIVAERVVRKAPCSVLTVRRGRPGPKASSASRRALHAPSVFLL